jgi:Superinfection immunity protein
LHVSSVSSSGGSAALGAVLIIIGIVAYGVPAIVAFARKDVSNTASIVVINLFLGWTIVGWVIALAMAVRSRPSMPQYVVPPDWAPPPQGWRQASAQQPPGWQPSVPQQARADGWPSDWTQR